MLLGRADVFARYFPHSIAHIWLKSRRAFACDLLKADMVSPLNARLCRILLSRARLAFRASRHSSSNQVFDFLGMVVALGMQSFGALVMCLTKECKGSASSSISSEMLSKHISWNCSQLALEKPSGKDHSLVVSLLVMVGLKSVWDNGHCHGYRVGPPTRFSKQVLVWRWSDLSLMLACSHAGLEDQIAVGSVIENTQIVFISESLNDFTPAVNIRTAPHVVVLIEVNRDKYLASYVSDQVWQISCGEVVVAWDVDRKNNDGCTTQSHLDCYRLEVRVNLNHLVVESLLDVDQDSSTWQLIWILPPRFAVAIIVGTSVVTQGWRVLQFCFLKAYGIRLMVAYQDIKIPSVTSQTSGVPLQPLWFGLFSHLAFAVLTEWCCFCHWWYDWDKGWPLPTQFQLPVRSWRLIGDVWGGIPRALNPAHLGWRHASTWASCACKLCLWGHVGLRDRGFVGLSHRGGVVGTSHGCGVLDTNKRGVRVGTTHHGPL